MPIPFPQLRAINALVAAEMLDAPLPYYGVNIFDVNTENLAAYTERMQAIAAHFAPISGFSPHFRAVRDYGGRKRLVRINHYTSDVSVDELRRLLLDNSAFEIDWARVMEVVEDYQFFVVQAEP